MIFFACFFSLICLCERLICHRLRLLIRSIVIISAIINVYEFISLILLRHSFICKNGAIIIMIRILSLRILYGD